MAPLVAFSVLKPDTRLSLIATADIGTAATAAIAEPERFHEVELELAGDLLTMERIAEVLSSALGTPLTAPDMTESEGLAAGMPDMGATHEYLNVAGQPTRPEFAAEPGISTSTFEQWAAEHLHAGA